MFHLWKSIKTFKSHYIHFFFHKSLLILAVKRIIHLRKLKMKNRAVILWCSLEYHISSDYVERPMIYNFFRMFC